MRFDVAQRVALWGAPSGFLVEVRQIRDVHYVRLLHLDPRQLG